LNKDKIVEKQESHGSYDISEHEIMGVDLKKGEECFRRIFKVAPMGLALIDYDFRIVKANDAFCQILGFSKNKLHGLKLFDIYRPRYINKYVEIFKKISTGEIISHETEIHCNNKNNQISWIRVYVTLLNNEKSFNNSYLIMIEDITKYKLADERMKNHLMKFNIGEGKIYLITESTPILSANVIKDLLTAGYKALIISRTPENDYRKALKGNYDFLWLAENSKGDFSTSNYNELESMIQEFPPKSVILIERIDYLIQMNGFEKTLNFIYKLREIAYMTALIIIISVDVRTMGEHKLLLIEKETNKIESRDLKNLSETDIEILKFISRQNAEGMKPTYSDAGNTLSISRPTVRKKIALLEGRGYLTVNKMGKSKVLEISEIGKSLFSK
jgi:PAS domain S-box-containing protein